MCFAERMRVCVFVLPRRYPDVAVLGHNFGIVFGGEEAIVDGTSASSPSFAGMVRAIVGTSIPFMCGHACVHPPHVAR